MTATGRPIRVAAQRGDRDRRDLTAELRADEAAMEQLATDYHVDRVIARGVFLRTRRDLRTHRRDPQAVEASAAADTLAEVLLSSYHSGLETPSHRRSCGFSCQSAVDASSPLTPPPDASGR